jgi:hypothetical protein
LLLVSLRCGRHAAVHDPDLLGNTNIDVPALLMRGVPIGGHRQIVAVMAESRAVADSGTDGVDTGGAALVELERSRMLAKHLHRLLAEFWISRMTAKNFCFRR